MPKNILKKFINSHHFPSQKVKAVYLFGSRARGDHRADSDYDLLLVVRDSFTSQDKDMLYGLVMDVLLETGNLLSLKIFRQSAYKNLVHQNTPFIQNINQERVLIG